MKTIKTKFASTVVAAAFGLALGFMSAPAQANPADENGCHDHKPCGEDPIVYTAELTIGAFVFGPSNIVEVTPNSRENALRSNEDLDMVRPSGPGDLEDTWNEVFNTCGELLDMDSVADFFAGDDNWRINKSGGVRVVFAGIELQGAEVTVQLIGDVFDFDTNPFLPESGQTRSYDLDQFAISGRSVSGTGPSRGCQPPGGGGFDIFFLDFPSTLKITAPAL